MFSIWVLQIAAVALSGFAVFLPHPLTWRLRIVTAGLPAWVVVPLTGVVHSAGSASR